MVHRDIKPHNLLLSVGRAPVTVGAGNDSLSGGSGQDSYAFAEYGAANSDSIANFDSGWDNLQLDAAGFGGIGASGRFAGLADDMLSNVLDTAAFIRFRLLQPSNACRRFPHQVGV